LPMTRGAVVEFIAIKHVADAFDASVEPERSMKIFPACPPFVGSAEYDPLSDP
jgi:hypothetical protein